MNGPCILKSTKFIDIVTKLPEIHAKGLGILEKVCHTGGSFLSKSRFTSIHGHNQVLLSKLRLKSEIKEQSRIFVMVNGGGDFWRTEFTNI